MSKKNVYILGPYNSGTNLLQNIFEYINGHRKQVNEIYGGLPGDKYMHGGGKHTIMDLPYLFHKIYQKDPTGVYIISFRNIYCWVTSCLKKPYLIEMNVNLDGSKSIYFCNKNWNSLVDIYNLYYSTYMELIDNYDNVIFVEYSEIIDFKGYIYLNNKIKPFDLYIPKNYFKYCLSQPSKIHNFDIESSVKNSLMALEKEQNIKTSYKDDTEIISKVDKRIIEFYK